MILAINIHIPDLYYQRIVTFLCSSHNVYTASEVTLTGSDRQVWLSDSQLETSEIHNLSQH